MYILSIDWQIISWKFWWVVTLQVHELLQLVVLFLQCEYLMPLWTIHEQEVNLFPTIYLLLQNAKCRTMKTASTSCWSLSWTRRASSVMFQFLRWGLHQFTARFEPAALCRLTNHPSLCRRRSRLVPFRLPSAPCAQVAWACCCCCPLASCS